ncbi:MAG TPA: Ig-like domain-containing protein [Streptosporangiaceae bacterium]|nr:Ig-like domain-containing protein [Streptosporangiaceae bacterium]
MNWKIPKPLRGRKVGRTAVLLGVAGATLGGMVLGAGVAHAALNPGAVNLNPTTGATSSTPTWATTTACATGFQGSAVFREVHSDGTTTNNISAATNSVAAPFTGTLQASIAQIQAAGGIPNGGTQELVVVCFSGASATGTADPEMEIFITYSADGSTYSTSAANNGPKSTTTTLNASPNPAQVGATVTLTATEVASDSSHPAGSIQFENGGTAIGAAVAVDATGTATMTTTFAAAGSEALTAVFTPTDTAHFNGSTGAATETVTTSNPNSGSEPLAVTVPATGSFTFTVAPGTVNLTVSGTNATGALNAVTVSDTRNTFPGWSVSGQSANFVGSGTAVGSTISGNQLGWAPTDTALGTGATLGATVAPASPGLGTTAAVLAQAHAGNGFGTSTLGANLTLAIPPTAAAGAYASTLTLTAVTSLP